MSDIFSVYALPCLYTFLACVGFTQVFNIHGIGKLICAVGGSFGWLIYLLPLVPGDGIYTAMRYCVAGDIQRFLDTLLYTFGMAAALAVGAMMTASLFRAVYPYLHFPKRKT